MMDIQQVIALAVVAAAAALLVLRYARGRRKPGFKECADCVQASTHGPAKGPIDTRPRAGSDAGRDASG
jgi:hypothetical protein